jgi:hypothetical protein
LGDATCHCCPERLDFVSNEILRILSAKRN